eukprot:gene3257-4077_t
MCGITGFLNWKQDVSKETVLLKKMTDSISHRGPDDEGFWFCKHVAFGHRRLIVIDPKGGHQPMIHTSNNKTVAMTYNGEIYNFKELRTELESKGHIFKTESDTEVLLHCYLEWKEECPKHLNGIFAFAIWDEEKQQLMMARDHIGVKPLFYAQRGETIIFGSEIKALLAHPLVKPEVDLLGLRDLLCEATIRPLGRAIFKDIVDLKPGHLVLTRDGVNLETRQFWKLETKPHTHSIEETANFIRNLMEDTVKRQLISDRPIVSLLSGGLDSSGLSSLASIEFQKQGKQLTTFSVTYTDEEKDFKPDVLHKHVDEPFAKLVSKYSNTNHKTIELDPLDMANYLLYMMRGRDLPGMGSFETSLYLFLKQISKEATVTLSGETADEIYSGYFWFHMEQFLNMDRSPWLTIWLIPELLSDQLLEKINCLEHQKKNYQDSIKDVTFLDDEDGLHRKQRVLSYIFITRFLLALLERKDRGGMIHGFEVRVPYADYRLVEYLYNVPLEIKSFGGIEKGILRKALSNILPPEVCNRVKSGYPAIHSPHYFKRICSWMNEIMEDPSSPILPFINIEKVKKLLIEGKVGYASQRNLEHLIQINYWIKEYNINFVDGCVDFLNQKNKSNL